MAKVWRILKSTQGKKSRLDPALNDGACAALMVNSGIGAFALVVDAKDEIAAAFYRHHGFLQIPSNPLTLFFPLAEVGTVSSLSHPPARP
jgi:hypothetical protein